MIQKNYESLTSSLINWQRLCEQMPLTHLLIWHLLRKPKIVC